MVNTKIIAIITENIEHKEHKKVASQQKRRFSGWRKLLAALISFVILIAPYASGVGLEIQWSKDQQPSSFDADCRSGNW